MKRNILFLTLFLLCSGTLFGQQEEPVELQTPDKNKSLVYFARRSAIGPLIKFRMYDGDMYLSRLSDWLGGAGISWGRTAYTSNFETYYPRWRR